MSAIAQQLSKLGITLSTPGTPAAAYVMAVTSGNQVFLSGHIAKQDGKPWVGNPGHRHGKVKASRSRAARIEPQHRTVLLDLRDVRMSRDDDIRPEGRFIDGQVTVMDENTEAGDDLQ